MRDKTVGRRSEQGLIRRRGVLTAIVALTAAAALLYYGAVWLVTERVKTMPEGPPPDECPVDAPSVDQVEKIEKMEQEE